ncbi:hypothetical protein JW859_09815 [bacterium]|nr:hypothetical protein [bacterium]
MSWRSSIHSLLFALAGVVWPLMISVCALLWPGPVLPDEYAPLAAIGFVPANLPPADKSGSTVRLVIVYDPRTASTHVMVDGEEAAEVSRIFWELPAEPAGEEAVGGEPADNGPAEPAG